MDPSSRHWKTRRENTRLDKYCERGETPINQKSKASGEKENRRIVRYKSPICRHRSPYCSYAVHSIGILIQRFQSPLWKNLKYVVSGYRRKYQVTFSSSRPASWRDGGDSLACFCTPSRGQHVAPKLTQTTSNLPLWFTFRLRPFAPQCACILNCGRPGESVWTGINS